MTFCATPEAIRGAVQALTGHSHVFLDCEGHTLGEVGGKLSLLNLGVIRHVQGEERRIAIFLIDTLAFEGTNAPHLVPIFDILKSDSVYKIMFDGRMDASELLHGHGVQLANVIDLQVADILSRERRGENVDGQLRRLVGFLPPQEVRVNRSRYLQVQRLNGLELALKEHGVRSGLKQQIDHSKWLQRPLSGASLSYAASDIRNICLLYLNFVQKGYINKEEAVKRSTAYLTLHAKGRPERNNKYKRHGLLPLALLSDASSTSVIRCGGCERDLPVSAFARSTTGSTDRFCFVCRAVETKANLSNNATSFFRGAYA